MPALIVSQMPVLRYCVSCCIDNLPGRKVGWEIAPYTVRLHHNARSRQAPDAATSHRGTRRAGLAAAMSQGASRRVRHVHLPRLATSASGFSRAYVVLAKGYSSTRSTRLADSVTTQYPDSKVARREVEWSGHWRYVRAVWRVAVRWCRANGQCGYGY